MSTAPPTTLPFPPSLHAWSAPSCPGPLVSTRLHISPAPSGLILKLISIQQPLGYYLYSGMIDCLSFHANDCDLAAPDLAFWFPVRVTSCSQKLHREMSLFEVECITMRDKIVGFVKLAFPAVPPHSLVSAASRAREIRSFKVVGFAQIAWRERVCCPLVVTSAGDSAMVKGVIRCIHNSQLLDQLSALFKRVYVVSFWFLCLHCMCSVCTCCYRMSALQAPPDQPVLFGTRTRNPKRKRPATGLNQPKKRQRLQSRD